MLSLLVMTALSGCGGDLLTCRATAKSAADLAECEKKSGCAAPAAACGGLDLQCFAACRDDACRAACGPKACPAALAAYRKCMSVGLEAVFDRRCDELCVATFGLPPARYTDDGTRSGPAAAGRVRPMPPELVGEWIEREAGPSASAMVVVQNDKPQPEVRTRLDIGAGGLFQQRIEVRREVGYNSSVELASAGFAIPDGDRLLLATTGTRGEVSACGSSYGSVNLAPRPQLYRFRLGPGRLELQDLEGRRTVLERAR